MRSALGRHRLRWLSKYAPPGNVVLLQPLMPPSFVSEHIYDRRCRDLNTRLPIGNIMGFFREQEIKAAARLLLWQYEKQNVPPPGSDQLDQQAARIVDDAHRIAKERGRNVLAIVKELVQEIKRR